MNSKIPAVLSTREIAENMDKDNVRIIDVRPVEAYNGWRLENEDRGGHIASAHSLPYKWLQYIDWIEIVIGKKIYPEHSLIIYGYDQDKTERVVKQFRRAGYTDLKIYNLFTKEWCSNESLPMQQLPNYCYLVSAQWLNQLINKQTAPEYKNNRFVICHVHYRNRDDYEEGFH